MVKGLTKEEIERIRSGSVEKISVREIGKCGQQAYKDWKFIEAGKDIVKIKYAPTKLSS